MKKIKKVIILILLLFTVLVVGYKIYLQWKFVWFKEERQEKMWNERVNMKNGEKKIKNKIYT
ncbi:hypothetical protein [Chryseobacterium sp. SL1]|uniref:hypothetical protein n=1 Tax=Chryseobacterium sp. SL1 TaxID=2995159 RepID=UPI002276B624|nr:hypothetical protein [Chryseobacterium sp. SL1]MCY1663101.1 hypothetical protein [Chryseobacterium sp. SL1]